MPAVLYRCAVCAATYEDPDALGEPYACPHCGRTLTMIELDEPRVLPAPDQNAPAAVKAAYLASGRHAQPKKRARLGRTGHGAK